MQNEECKIDSLTQSWAVLSQTAQPQRAERAMEAVRAHLVRRDAGLVLLLTPPFDRTAHDPGYIKGYLPGIRENGGQYTHAALWTVIALARLGQGDAAMELFHMLNPINHMRTPEDVDRYRAEPYAVAADVYAHPMHVGRGGWTWYTGSAGWMYQAAIEALLGLRRAASTFSMNPCIPATWPRYSLEWRAGRALYRITVMNPERMCRGVASAMIDGHTGRPRRDSLARRRRRHIRRHSRPWEAWRRGQAHGGLPRGGTQVNYSIASSPNVHFQRGRISDPPLSATVAGNRIVS